MRYPAADTKSLVYSDSFGVRGDNYYWHNAERFGITKEELAEEGITDARVKVDKSMEASLKAAQAKLNEHGYDIVIKDGYRSPSMYELAHRKRSETMGKTDQLINLEAMPHASGRVVDIDLVDAKSGKPVEMRNREDGLEACFVNFYRDKTDAKSRQYQCLQDLLVDTMKDLGFVLGSKDEYWHFELPPDK